MGKKIVDGVYSTMIERLQSDSNPNFSRDCKLNCVNHL